MNINSILTEWTYRLESGYPKHDADYDVLHEVIMEMTDLSESDADRIVTQARGLTEDETDNMGGMVQLNPNSEGDDFADLLDIIKNKTRTDQLKELAAYTKKHYNPGFDTEFSIYDIDQYTDGFSGHYTPGNNISTDLPIYKYTGDGVRAEAIIFAYMNSKYGTNIQHITKQLPGVDGEDKTLGATFEVKTATSKNFNLNLQTTFWPNNPNKYYIFGYRSESGSRFKSITPIYIISSQLLRRVSLGEQIYSELGSESKISDTLNAQIEAGLKQTNFKDQIAAVITTGDTAGFTKQFDIGNNVAVVFKIFLQPKKF